MAKRGNGEGSIFMRADGRWYSALTYRDDVGEVRRREVSGRTQAEVRAKLRELRERVEAGAPVKDASITMAVWLEDWTTKALPASDRKPATIDLYATIARSHLVPKLGSPPLDRLRPPRRRGPGARQAPRRPFCVIRPDDLHGAPGRPRRRGPGRADPAQSGRPGQTPGRRARRRGHLPAQQVEALLEAIRGDRPESLHRVMLATGLRRGEALALHWRDVDLDAAVIRVRWTLSRTSAGPGLGLPKTEKSRRTVPLPVPAVETLRAHRKRQAAEQLAAGSLWQASGLVFTSEIGTPLEPRNALRRFEALAERAGLRGVRLHTLRHSAASFLLAAGTHMKVVQEHLGHSSYAITADIYSHVAPVQQREAADKLGQAIR
ncbi:site-specific integrase [Geodermatophilus maliterrae]|uniref:Site-specific integrase n=1 Tax=Geodermatophilus maliterrae TaxID=3162531 RepID=A0ABV3XB90_9ACTN